MKAVLTRESPVDVSETEPTKTLDGSSLTPLTQDITKAVQIHKEDPWITLLERIWEANPYSDWVPVDDGEILNDSRLIWLDTLRHPFRLQRLANDFVQQSTQVMTKRMYWRSDNRPADWLVQGDGRKQVCTHPLAVKRESE